MVRPPCAQISSQAGRLLTHATHRYREGPRGDARRCKPHSFQQRGGRALTRAGNARRPRTSRSASRRSAVTRRPPRRSRARRFLCGFCRTARLRRRARSPTSKMQRGPGTWRSTPSRSAPATASSRRRLSMPPITSRFCRCRSGRASTSTVVPSNAARRDRPRRARAELGAGGVRLVALTHVPTQGGLVNPAAEVGRLAQGARRALPARRLPVGRPDAGRCRRDRLRHAVGHRAQVPARAARHRFPLRAPATSSTSSSRRSSTCRQPRSQRAGGYRMMPDAPRFENWESFVAGRIGLGQGRALCAAISGSKRSGSACSRLADRLRGALAEIPGVTITDLGRERCGIVTFIKADEAPDAIKAAAGRAADQRLGLAGALCRRSISAGAASTPSCAPRCTTTTPRTRSTASAACWPAGSRPDRRPETDAAGRRT